MNNPASFGQLDQTSLDALREMVGGDEAFLAEMVDTFVDDAPRLVAEMRSTAAAGDTVSLRRAAHSLKSNCRTFGAARLGEMCQQIEERAKNAETDGFTPQIDEIETAFPLVFAALQERLGGSR